jgi:glycerol-3-phosphate dehydrogenase
MKPTSPPRSERLEALSRSPFDATVVGGGITGAGVALDLSLRGLRVLLAEREDWAAETSSASSRLVHGGLRYLEQLDLTLVRESCRERALLLSNGAGIVWPERFLFPVREGDRVGRARLFAGLSLYTLLSLPRPLGLPFLIGPRGAANAVSGIDMAGLRGAGVYLDGATGDARLVLAVVKTAERAGALAISRLEAVAIESGASGADLLLRDSLTGAQHPVQSRAVVLCGGPFTEGLRARAGLRGSWTAPTRGSHILVPRDRLPTDGAVIFTSRLDGRVMFLLPWPRFTAIGTTDLDADPASPVQATRDEVAYLLGSANALVPGAQLLEADVVSSWSGLRPLLAAPQANPSARSREERIERDGCVYTIAGGKLTGFRSMAEKLCARLCDDLALGQGGATSPTRTHRLHGALAKRIERPSWSRWSGGVRGAAEPSLLGSALQRRYGTLASSVRARCQASPEGLQPLDPETLLGEIDWSIDCEDCLAPSDFLLRRTDLGYGPSAEVLPRAELVIERMAQRLSWSKEQRAWASSEWRQRFARMHAWRSEKPVHPEKKPAGELAQP